MMHIARRASHASYHNNVAYCAKEGKRCGKDAEEININEDEELGAASCLLWDQKHEVIKSRMVITIAVILRMFSALMLRKKITWIKM